MATHGRNSLFYIDDATGACKNITATTTNVVLNRSKSNPDTTTMGENSPQRDVDGLRDASFDCTFIYNHGTGSCPVELLDSMYSNNEIRRVQYFPQGASETSYSACSRLESLSVTSPVEGLNIVNATMTNNRFLTNRAGGYWKRVLNTATSNLIGYWPLWEYSGTVANNIGSGTTTRNGAYNSAVSTWPTAEGIGDGNVAPTFDGANDYVNVYSAGLAGAFNGAEGTMMLWVKVSAAGIWSDGNTHQLFDCAVDADNRVCIGKSSSVNKIFFTYAAGGTVEGPTASVSSLDWINVCWTWSKTGNLCIPYINGVAGSTATDLGTWSGSLASTLCTIGIRDTASPLYYWNGKTAHCALWNTVLTPTQVAYLGTL